MKGNRRVRLFSLIISALSILLVLSLVFAKNHNTKTTNQTFNQTTDSYISDSSEIASVSSRPDTDSSVRLSSLYTISSKTVTRNSTSYDGTTTISISNAEELYAFSYLCYTTPAFLGYNYSLLANIEYESYGAAGYYFYPVACLNTKFTGTFNGNGFDIHDLYMAPLTDANTASGGQFAGYSSITYYAMFGQVGSTGIIENFGLIDTEISINATTLGNLAYVAALVGNNEGKVRNVYVQDLRKADDETAGITAAGEYQVSGLMYINNGEFENSYTAYSIVVNYTLSSTVAQWHEILVVNEGTVSNLFFTNESITLDGYSISGKKETIIYDAILIGQRVTRDITGATYEADVDALNEAVCASSTNWYSKNSYGTDLVKPLESVKTPITRGLEYDTDTKTFTITNEHDYVYMYELFNISAYFTSSAITYKFTNDIDLQYTPTDIYTCDRNIGCKFVGTSSDRNTLIDKTGDASSYPTIFNATIFNTVTTEGMVCYGVFPWFTGSINGLNFYFDNQLTVNPTSVISNINAVGLVTGYAESATINNVNVYGKVTLGANIGRVYAGGIAGIVGGNSTLSNATTSGSIAGVSSQIFTSSTITGYPNGIAIGGAIGYVNDSYANLNTILTSMTITAPTYSSSNSIDVALGGVVGVGYTAIVNGLQNKGDITATGSYYGNLYVAGVFGRIVGVKQQIKYFHNQGDITVSSANANLYIAGAMNVDLQTTTGSTLSVSLYKDSASKYIFYASSVTNGGKVSVDTKPTSIMYAGVANINSSKGFLSTLSGIYNLTYKYADNNTSKVFDKTVQSINMYIVPTFAAVVNTNATSDNGLIDASYIYNFRSYSFVTTQSTSIDYSYSGCINGSYVTGSELRNEGNLSFTLSNQIGTSSAAKTIKITGILTEVSSGCAITSVYNGGNISVNYTAKMYAKIYAAGICYANKNGFTNLNQFDPSSEEYNDKAIGSINYCINNGSITVTNPNYSSMSFTSYYEVKSANGDVVTERHYYANSAASANLVGDICVSGITNYNYSVITNTFNVADMFAANYITSTVKNEINASGLVTYNIGSAAIIENSANDGTIKAINLSFYMVFNNGKTNVNITTAQYAFVNASGIVCHNDETDTGAAYSNAGTNSKQIIAFTINYGSIYSYNYARNSTSSASSAFRTISAGILGQGLLNLVNVVNYGNIYGSEVSGGIVGVMFFDNFNTEVNKNNTVTLANTINYANIMVIDKGELTYRDSSYYNQTYSSFVSLTGSSTCFYTSLAVYSKDYFNGSIFGIINFSGSSNANFVTIRYLISFNEDVTLVGAEAQTPSSVTVDLSTFYSAYAYYDGSYTLDTYIGKTVVYSPLSTGTVRINGTTYYGVFNSNFSFRQAVNGNEAYLDIANHPTDAFVSDYFEFVGATYINQYLLDTIGWGDIAYSAAADSFATSLDGVAKFITYLSNNNSTQYNNLLTAALSTDTWISKCATEDLLEIVQTLIDNEQSGELLAMLQYIFSNESTSYSLISTETRSKILEKLVENDTSLDYSELIESIITYSNGYSSVLADSILGNDEAGTYIYDYLDDLTDSQLESLLTSYCEYLKDQSANAYFTYSNNEQVRYDILTAVFENINDTTFYTYLAEIIGIDLSNVNVSDEITMYNGLSTIDDSTLVSVYKAILLNNSYANITTYVNAMSDEIDFYINMINRGYLKTSLDNIYTDVSASTSSTATTTVDERVALWNQIRTTDTFKNYLSTKITSEYIAKATEVNNTYQTTTYPYESAYSTSGDLSFTYTFDITPATNFLGPYTNTSKNQFSYVPMTNSYAPTCGDSNTTKRSIIDVTTKAEADYLYNNGYTHFYQLFYYEYSDSSSNNQLCAVRRYIDGSIENKYAFTWFKTARTTDFTGGFLRGTYKDVNDSWVQGETWVDESILVTDTSGVTFDANGGGISKFTSNSDGSTETNNYAYNLTKTGTWVITDANQKQHTITGTLTDWADFIIAHEVRHYISYPTDKYHETLCTGLGKYRSGDRWFTWKNTGTSVYTSQYIDYSVDQLLALDGYLTSYNDGTTQSADERDIINSLFNTYFVADSTNFKNMIAAALLEKNAQIDNDSYYYVGTPEFNGTTRIYYRLTATAATSYNENTTYYLKSGNDYIVASGVNSSNYANYYTVTATRVNDYYNYSDCYVMKDVDGYDADYIFDMLVTNIYTSTKVASTAPFEYLYIPTSITSGSLITVKQFLMGLTSTSNVKDKFIGYCANNQQAYSKLLLELMKINTLEKPIVSIEFPTTIGDSSTSGVSISNMFYYKTLSVVNDPSTINGKTYDYGYTFEGFAINTDTSWTKVYLYLDSTEGVYLYYQYDDSTDWEGYKYVNGPTVVDIALDNNTYVYCAINSSYVGAITLYYVEAAVSETVSNTNSLKYTLIYSGTSQNGSNKPGYYIYQLPTASNIESMIASDLSTKGLSYKSYTYTISADITSHNNDSGGTSHEIYHRIIIDNDTYDYTQDGMIVLGTSTTKINKNKTFNVVADIPNDQLGNYLGVLSCSTNESWSYWTYYTSKRNNGCYRIRFYSIYLTINYTYYYDAESSNRLSVVTQDQIYGTVAYNGFTKENYCTLTLKDDSSYTTKYNNMLLDATYNLVPVNYVEKAYNNTLVSNTYYVLNGTEYTFATGAYNSANTYYVRSGDGTEEDPYVYTEATITSSQYYSTTTSNKYYVLNGTEYTFATGAYNSSTTYYKYNTEYYEAETAGMNIVDLLGFSATHQSTGDYCVPELLSKLITTSNEAFSAFITNAVSTSENAVSDYSVIIKYLTENVGYYSLNDAIKSGKSTLSTETKEIIAAAYLVTDYKTILTNETSVYDSYLRTYIDNSLATTYRYINSDGSYDNDKFEEFCKLIGYNLSTSGYGIYALSSNHGKLNGEFIPDNLVLGKMDAPYSYSSEGECYVLTSANTNSWRGTSTTDGDVQYAFDVEMKQLVKSISTAIFELDLISATDDVVLYSSESSIDLENHTITYYVPKGSTYTDSLTIDTNSMVLANNATLYLNGTLVVPGTTTSSFSLNVGENEGLIRVYAENTAVFDDYTLIIVEADFSFDLTELNNTASGSLHVAYTDDTITINVTSPKSTEPDKDSLPEGLDLTPYITIQDTTGTVMTKAFTLTEAPVIDATGATTIYLEILSTLPTGTYDIVVNIYGSIEKYRFIKDASTECDILSFEYNGADLVSSFTEESSRVYAVSSTVLYGRAFDYTELTDYNGSNFYLTLLTYSNGASISVSATKTETDGLMTYVISYVVTAEDTSTKTYKHYVSEAAPFKDGSSYVSSYQDGEIVTEQTKNYSSNSANNIVKFEFRRGTEPVNRVKYSLGGFYILGNATYSYDTEEEYSEEDVSISCLTAGLSIVVTDSADAGTYTIYYKYTSSGTWSDGTYLRDYEFPAVKVTKLASTDALLDNITFISSASKLSTLSTVMYPLGPVRPTADDLVTADNEVAYSYLSASSANNLINVNTTGIIYNNYDADTYSNYYIVGAVSNVNLSSYSPTFEIDDYAKIYQYTTLSKITGYGTDNNQTATDKTILENDDTLYIYVPYTDGTSIKVFLIKVDASNKYKWTAAYEDNWDGSSATTVTSFNTSTHAITFDGKTYTVSSLAGTTNANNSSLYMNYIGNPLTDSDPDDDKDDSHFWYVSYIVFSEDALVNGTSKVKYYHISMIDLENTNYYEFKILAPSSITADTIYITLVYRVYDEYNASGTYQKTETLSIFADYDSTLGSYKVYTPNVDLSLLPRGYYYFQLSLPGGYEATYEVTNGKTNRNTNEDEDNGYLPPASIIIQEIDITITITATEGSTTGGGAWGQHTSSKQPITATEK